MAMNFQTTGDTKVSSVACCLLFDPQDGKIRHVHRVVTMQGAPALSRSEIEARTLRLASKMGMDTASLRLLHVEEEALSERARYTVDPVSHQLVKHKIGNEEMPKFR